MLDVLLTILDFRNYPHYPRGVPISAILSFEGKKPLMIFHYSQKFRENIQDQLIFLSLTELPELYTQLLAVMFRLMTGIL